MKVAVVGGGSTYTPELIEGLAVRDDRVRIDDLVLLDIDPDRAEIVGGMARRQLARLGWAGRLQISGVLEASLDGADFVIVQLRVGGQAARFVDETLPPRFGTIGQETTGAGGFAKALRTVPVVLDIAEKADRLAAPGHWIVDFTNPVGIVSQALLDDGHRAIGLCNVAIGFQRRFAARFGVEPERVELEHVGLNHLTWIRAVRVDGVDRLPELLDEDGDAIAEDVGVPPEFVRSLRAIPSYYLRYYYLFETVLADQRRDGHATRAEEVAKIERELLAMYRDPTLDEKPALLAQPRRGVLQRGGRPADRLAPGRQRRRPGREHPQRRRARRPARRRRRRDPGPDRSRRRPPGRAATARAGHAGARPGASRATSGSRSGRRRAATGRPLCGRSSRTRSSAASTSPGRCSTPCSRRTRGSCRRSKAPPRAEPGVIVTPT